MGAHMLYGTVLPACHPADVTFPPWIKCVWSACQMYCCITMYWLIHRPTDCTNNQLVYKTKRVQQQSLTTRVTSCDIITIPLIQFTGGNPPLPPPTAVVWCWSHGENALRIEPTRQKFLHTAVATVSADQHGVWVKLPLHSGDVSPWTWWSRPWCWMLGPCPVS